MAKPIVRLSLFFMLLMFGTYNSSAASQTPERLQPTPVPLPGGRAGIGFDDLGCAPDLNRVIVAAGRSGNLDLIDPTTLNVTTIPGFSAQDQYGGGHDESITSADTGDHVLFATDHTKQALDAIDPATETIIASVAVAADPDYVRYVPDTNEVWVTEPDREQIEVFSLSDKQAPTHAVVIAVPGGPESLVIDKAHSRAYTHLWNGKTVAIEVKRHTILATWANGCAASRGIALDEQRGFLFVGCSEGKAVVLDVNHDGRQLASLADGAGVDVISYNPTLAHLYLPGASSATMAILGVAKDGKLTLLDRVHTAQGAHCVTADDLGNAWVCDPDHGQLLLIKDPFPSSDGPNQP